MKKTLNHILTFVLIAIFASCFWGEIINGYKYLKNTFNWGYPENIALGIVLFCAVWGWIAH